MATRSRRAITSALIGASAGALVLTVLPLSPVAAEPPLTAAQAQQRVDALYEQAEAAAEDLNEAALQVIEAERQQTTVKKRMAREQAVLDEVREDIGVFASVAYRSGGLDSDLELLLSDDPGEFLNRSASLDQVSRSQNATLRRAAVSQQRLAQDRAVLDEQVKQLEAIASKAQEAQARIDAKADEAKAVLNRLEARERERYEAAQRARAAESLRASRSALRTVETTSSSSSRSGGSSSAAKPKSSGFSGGSSGSGRAATAVATAKAQVGDRYVWGAGGPNSFDCSGLTSYAWRSAGVSLPHQSRAQFAATSRVSKGALQPGDLVFFYSPISHVGIYIGGGLMVHASNPSTGVRVDTINGGHWAGSYVGGGRV